MDLFRIPALTEVKYRRHVSFRFRLFDKPIIGDLGNL
jgi:hypothetical protein